MTNQPTDAPLFQAYKAYLEKIELFLNEEKEKFQKTLKSTVPKNKDSDYEKIVLDANNKIVEKIDAAIKEISTFIEKLEQEKKRKIQSARDTRPSKKSNI
ncbi:MULTISPECIES: hypothetical protein [Nostoc]|uniref:Uncharacterized protein n=1 Tax=Nostoc paludosum FACHB-159 TaxID=2692908 RepID=A0ABR8KH72_9NOSO|nr:MULTISPECIES: hypothetical protein [Nostoc]MBD2681865.1 hypothetical protein [Nostoc sp. FACHB-857]MBD2738209.1 hypothetical protein [Nostoc paludosum FACHB-159]